MKDSARERSLELLTFWYSNRCAEGAQRYHPDKSDLAMTQASTSRQNGARDNGRPLTARGTQTRTYDEGLKGAYPAGPVTDPYAKYGNAGQRSKMEKYARDCMLHVINVNPDYQRACEMYAAKWRLEEIAAELDVSVHKARTYLECGITSITNYRILVKP